MMMICVTPTVVALLLNLHLLLLLSLALRQLLLRRRRLRLCWAFLGALFPAVVTADNSNNSMHTRDAPKVNFSLRPANDDCHALRAQVDTSHHNDGYTPHNLLPQMELKVWYARQLLLLLNENCWALSQSQSIKAQLWALIPLFRNLQTLIYLMTSCV